jgi:hypothetical protein
MSEDQSNSIFSLIGKSLPFDLINSYVECLTVVIGILDSKVEKHAKEIIERAVDIVMKILGQ